MRPNFSKAFFMQVHRRDSLELLLKRRQLLQEFRSCEKLQEAFEERIML